MSQEAVERFLGRVLTDDVFRKRAEESIAGMCSEFGFDLNPDELKALCRDDLIRLDIVSYQLDKNIKRFS
jgi:hypothetical protein